MGEESGPIAMLETGEDLAHEPRIDCHDQLPSTSPKES
jgi:hypothetical protein